MKTRNDFFKKLYKKRSKILNAEELSGATNSDFLITISLEPNVVDPRYFKL